MSTKIPAIKIVQNDKNILFFSVPAKELIRISYYNPRELDREEGIQRDFKQQRSRAIAKYIDSDESSLANNIIINFEFLKNKLNMVDVFDEDKNELNFNLIKRVSRRSKNGIKGKIAFVIDGQHRLRAFEFSKNKDFPLIVSAFIDLSLAEVAELFVSINYNQKPVNKSLVLDLLGISKKVFPKYWKLHNVVKNLNEDLGSPFYGKIKMLGTGQGLISQASIISAIEKYKIEKTLLANDITPTENVVYDIVWNFFSAVENELADFWGDKKILSKSVGTRALFMLLRDILEHCIHNKKKFSMSTIAKFLKQINRGIFSAEKTEFLIGEKGVKKLHDEMNESIRNKYDF